MFLCIPTPRPIIIRVGPFVDWDHFSSPFVRLLLQHFQDNYKRAVSLYRGCLLHPLKCGFGSPLTIPELQFFYGGWGEFPPRYTVE